MSRKYFTNRNGIPFTASPDHIMIMHPDIKFGITLYYNPVITKETVMQHMKMNLKFNVEYDNWGPDKFETVLDEICPGEELELFEMTGNGIWFKIKGFFRGRVIISIPELKTILKAKETLEEIVNEGGIITRFLTEKQRMVREGLLNEIDSQRPSVKRLIQSPKMQNLEDHILVNPYMDLGQENE